MAHPALRGIYQLFFTMNSFFFVMSRKKGHHQMDVLHWDRTSRFTVQRHSVLTTFTDVGEVDHVLWRKYNHFLEISRAAQYGINT